MVAVHLKTKKCTALFIMKSFPSRFLFYKIRQKPHSLPSITWLLDFNLDCYNNYMQALSFHVRQMNSSIKQLVKIALDIVIFTIQ